MSRRLAIVAIALVSATAAPSFAALSLSQADGPAPVTYANGGGNGFSGAVGNGSFSFDTVGTGLTVGFTAGGTLNDNAVLYLDTRAGGILDSQMSDRADGGRVAVSELTLNADDAFPAGFLPDFAVVYGTFGTVVFELNAGSTPGHLGFVSFVDPAGGVPQPVTLSLATLGSPTNVDFFASYTSNSGFNSNESLPATTLGVNQGGNPGEAGPSAGYDNFNRFVAVPEPTTLALLGGVAAVALRRRRK